MINVNELRPGNKILYKGIVIHVEPAEYSHILENPENYCPIPITPENLQAFGFIQHHDDCSNGVIMLKHIFSPEPYQYKIFPDQLGSAEEPNQAARLSYIHQIQNLYHSLTFQELPYSL